MTNQVTREDCGISENRSQSRGKINITFYWGFIVNHILVNLKTRESKFSAKSGTIRGRTVEEIMFYGNPPDADFSNKTKKTEKSILGSHHASSKTSLHQQSSTASLNNASEIKAKEDRDLGIVIASF